MVHPQTTVTRRSGRAGEGGYDRRRRADRATRRASAAPTTLHRRARGLRRRHARHPAAAAPAARPTASCRALSRRGSGADPHELRGDAGCAGPGRRPTPTTPAAWRSRRRSTPTPHTHIEPVRYGKGSNAMGLLPTVLTDGADGVPRLATWLRAVPGGTRATALRPLSVRALVRAHDHRAGHADRWTTRSRCPRKRRRRGRWRLRSRQGHGEPNPTWIPAATRRCGGWPRSIGGMAGRQRSARSSTCR